jgi:CHAT domain-containing protein
MIPAGSNVIVVPDGPLYGLNFETLLVGGERPRYWIEDVTLSIAPSLGVLQTGRRRPREPSLLLMGSPVPPSEEYPALPDAELEIGNIRRHFPAGQASVMTGAEAHPDAYKEADPGRFTLIHFSAHARANRESPLDSAVILSRRQDSYKLYARDVAAVPLKAELVTISACRSAGARQYSGEGLVGFSWAFLQAGARNVIAGLWDVNDRSTALLMSRLYEELERGKAPAQALRAAKLAFLENPVYRKPYHWAPFELFTRSTPFNSTIKLATR